MEVNLDQIEFYHGPSHPSAKDVPSNHASNHAFRYPQQTFPTGFGFRPKQCEVSLGQSLPLTGITREWNIFDFEINHLNDYTRAEMTEELEPAVARNLPAGTISSSNSGSSFLELSEPAPLTDLTRTNSGLTKPGHLDLVSLNMRGNDLPAAIPDTRATESRQISCLFSETAPVEVSCAVGDRCAVVDSQQEPAKQQSSMTEPSRTLHPMDTESAMVPSEVSELVENIRFRANETPEWAENPVTSEDVSATSGPSSPPTARSSVQTTRSSDVSGRYPSIAVVVPLPSQKEGATRTSTRAAAAVCKKRLRSGRRTDYFQDGNKIYDTEQPCQRRKKRRPPRRSSSGPSNSSLSVPSHHSGATQDLRGNAILTVDTNSGLKPAYYFTFVPDPSPVLCQPDTQVVPGKQRSYSSDENALLVRLREKEAMLWSEITTHFPGRSMSSLQVHYSTKLRHKATSRSGTRKRRE